MPQSERHLIRKPRGTIREDEAHFWRVAGPLGLVLMLTLPLAFGWIDRHTPPEAMTTTPAQPPIWQAREN